MSGGSLDYLSYKIEEVAHKLKGVGMPPSYRAFGNHLILVANALHSVEWQLSGDTTPGGDEDDIKVVLGAAYRSEVLEVLKTDLDKLEQSVKQLKSDING